MRLEALKLLLVNHPVDCPVCDAAGECQLQNRTYEFGIEKNELLNKLVASYDDPKKFIYTHFM